MMLRALDFTAYRSRRDTSLSRRFLFYRALAKCFVGHEKFTFNEEGLHKTEDTESAAGLGGQL